MCGIYFQLRNVPEFCRSKLSNIFLVALVKVEDIKNNHKLYDNVFDLIITDLKSMETNGIQISPNINLKGGLVNISCDNLGANSVFGFPESFNANFYCRMCECHKTKCKLLVLEDSAKIRGKQNYSEHLKMIKNNPDCELKLSKGVINYCPFNDLKYFHVLDNFSVDIMHDLYEGVIPFFLKLLFSNMSSKKILSDIEIQAKIRDFDYGILNKKSQPSTLKLKRKNLGQCAAQSYNLFNHTPFIFAEHRSQIPVVWEAMEQLLQISQIIHSASIKDEDVDRLKSCVEKYLTYLVHECQVELTPKHHNMTHYPTVIRKMGPLIHMWMMRMECKHKTFTDMVKRTNNYMNLPKTLAQQHQEIICKEKHIYMLKITHSKSTYNIAASKNISDYKFCLPTLSDDQKLRGFKFLKYESYEYRPGLIIFNNQMFFEIIHIFLYQNRKFILCHPYSTKGFELCYNSLEVEKESTFCNSCLFCIDDIENKKTYEKITQSGKMYIFADSLDVFNEF